MGILSLWWSPKGYFCIHGYMPKTTVKSYCTSSTGVLQKLSHKRPVTNCPWFPKGVIHVLALTMASKIFSSPPYMYVPTGDLFLVLTFVHKWDAWVILPLLSNNTFIASLIFPCITHFLGSFLLHCYSTIFEEWLISIIYHFSDKSRNFTRSGLQVSSDFLVQWRPKKLGTVWRKTLLRTLLLMSIFWSALGSSRRDPTPNPPPPPAMLWPPMLRKIQLCLVGGEGRFR